MITYHCVVQTADEDLVVGGPGLAYWLQTNPQEFPDDKRVSGTYFATQTSNSSLPLNFFSFHAVAACTDSASCDIKNVRHLLSPSIIKIESVLALLYTLGAFFLR